MSAPTESVPPINDLLRTPTAGQDMTKVLFPGAQPPAVLVSPKGSSVGWSWRVWLVKQKSVIKTFVSLLGAFLISIVPTTLDPNLQNAISIGIGIGIRAALDWLDFYLSEVPLETRQ